jgi:hypothetical protein
VSDESAPAQPAPTQPAAPAQLDRPVMAEPSEPARPALPQPDPRLIKQEYHSRDGAPAVQADDFLRRRP